MLKFYMIPMSASWRRFLMVVVLLLTGSPPCSSSSRGFQSNGDRRAEYEIFTRPRVRAGPGRRDVRRRSMLADASTSSPRGICGGIIKAAGYPCEEITVETSDGFLLGMQHIPYGLAGSNRKRKRPPVFLQHGLAQGGDDWVLNSPAQSLAYILADHGFDVWIGNLRGTRFGRGHKTLSPSDWRFWDWSFDEHASLDLPAMVSYVLKATGSQVYYVGHSQGTMLVLAALSEAGTRMSEMVKAAVLLAPVAYLQHMKSPLLSISAALMLDTIVGLFGTREFNLKNEVGETLINQACAEPHVAVCDDLVEAFTGPNCCFNMSRSLYYSHWEPQSTSTKNLQHLAQLVRSGRFEKFDHGLLGNVAQYRQVAPPLYDFAKLPPSTNLFMISGGRDALADSSDVMRLEDELSCSVSSLVLPGYGHADFVVGTRAHLDVYHPIIQYFRSLD